MRRIIMSASPFSDQLIMLNVNITRRTVCIRRKMNVNTEMKLVFGNVFRFRSLRSSPSGVYTTCSSIFEVLPCVKIQQKRCLFKFQLATRAVAASRYLTSNNFQLDVEKLNRRAFFPRGCCEVSSPDNGLIKKVTRKILQQKIMFVSFVCFTNKCEPII